LESVQEYQELGTMINSIKKWRMRTFIKKYGMIETKKSIDQKTHFKIFFRTSINLREVKEQK